MPPRPRGALWMGDWIRAHRARLGLTRRAAVRAGAVPPAPLTPTLLADFECGDRLPTLARLPALGRALGVSPREIADWILLSGDREADLERIRAFYADKRGCRPERAGEIRFRD